MCECVSATITHTHLQVVIEIPGLLNHQVASSSEVLHRSQNTLLTQVSCLIVRRTDSTCVCLCVSACVIHRFHNSFTGRGSTFRDSTGTRTPHAASDAAVLTASFHGTAAVHATDTLQCHVPPGPAQRAVPAAVHAQLSSFCVLSPQSDDAAVPWPSPIKPITRPPTIRRASAELSWTILTRIQPWLPRRCLPVSKCETRRV